MGRYEFLADINGATFNDLDDVVRALFMVAPYLEIEVEMDQVKRTLEEEGFWEEFPLSITRTA